MLGKTALAANVLNDPGFEATPGGVQTATVVGWTTFGDGANTFTETSTSIAHSGSNYFKVFQEFTGSINYSGAFQDVPTLPGATYTANGWAYTLSSDTLAGNNLAWLEVTFRDFNTNIITLYRSEIVGTNLIQTGKFNPNTWYNLLVTNQCTPATGQVIGSVTNLVAPPGTRFVRTQITFQGDANYSGGSMYFDDLTLNQTGAATSGWNIVWSDEFNGTTINPSNWSFNIGTGPPYPGWGNNELEYYTARTNNAYVANGLLNIVAQEESYDGSSYTSAKLVSSGLFSKTYGEFIWRAKLPTGQGYWPALWLYPESSVYGGWAASGELDVMENMGNDPTNVLGTIHFGGVYPDNTQSYGPSYTFSNDSVTNWHTYSVLWSTNFIDWAVDGQIYEVQTNWYSSTTTNSTNAYPAPFNEPFYIIMNLAVGGNFGGNPNGTTVFPGIMQVDYARVYDFTPPLQLAATQTNNALRLIWPTNIVCHLQAQTNAGGLTTNWVDLPTATSPYTVPAGSTPGNVFYRLESP